MLTDRIVHAGYFTDNVAAKAAIATTSVVGVNLFDSICQLNTATAAVCHLALGVPVLLKLLLAMMGLDLISGVLAARSDGERITSRRLGVGVKRKTFMLVCVAAAVVLDAVFREQGFSLGGVLFQWVTSWFIAVEALSLYENGERLGVPMPAFLKSGIEWLIQKAGKSGQVGLPQPDASEAPTNTTQESNG